MSVTLKNTPNYLCVIHPATGEFCLPIAFFDMVCFTVYRNEMRAPVWLSCSKGRCLTFKFTFRCSAIRITENRHVMIFFVPFPCCPLGKCCPGRPPMSPKSKTATAKWFQSVTLSAARPSPRGWEDKFYTPKCVTTNGNLTFMLYCFLTNYMKVHEISEN